MLSRPRALALLAAGFLTATAGGAYFAMTRPAEIPAQPANQAFVQQPGPPAPDTAPGASSAPVPVTVSQADEGIAEPLEESRPRVEARRAPVRSRPVPRREPSPEREPVGATTTASVPTVPETRPEEPVPAPMPAAEPVTEPVAQARFEEITIPSETVIGVQVDTAVSSDRARVEDRVEGHVTRDVAVDGRVAIPAGTRLIGSVTLVERGGKFKERARIAVRFHTARLADGSQIALQTTAVMREGDSPARESAGKVGGAAVGGAILGAILGGGKGAIIGGTAGAAGGTAVVAAGDRNPATLPAGSTVTVRLMADVTLTVER